MHTDHNFNSELSVSIEPDVVGGEPLPAISKAFGKGHTIHLVDDEPIVTLLAKTIMNSLGFSVLAAANGKEALELYRENAADITLVFSDIDMPVMDGYRLFSALQHADPELPIVICSGLEERAVTSRIPGGKLAGFLRKPYLVRQLQKLLQTVVITCYGSHPSSQHRVSGDEKKCKS